jgi:biopolymer transport protein ExbD
MEFVRNRRKLRAINMVSLIDIIFTVILFFIVAGHLEKFSIIPIDLPKADSGQRLDEGPIVVLLGSLGEVIVNDELYSNEQVAAELKREFSVNPERIITIKADAKMEANTLVDFLEQIRAAGGKNLSLVTQSGEVGVTQ